MQIVVQIGVGLLVGALGIELWRLSRSYIAAKPLLGWIVRLIAIHLLCSSVGLFIAAPLQLSSRQGIAAQPAPTRTLTIEEFFKDFDFRERTLTPGK